MKRYPGSQPTRTPPPSPKPTTPGATALVITPEGPTTATPPGLGAAKAEAMAKMAKTTTRRYFMMAFKNSEVN